MIFIKKFLTFTFFILFFGLVFSADYSITDITVPKVAFEDQNILITIHLLNNSSAQKALNLDVNLYSPSEDELFSDSSVLATVPANTVLDYTYKIVVTDTNASNIPHVIRVNIKDTDTNPANNMMQKYITISKGVRKTPVPDMPIALGLVVGVFVVFFINKKKE